MLACSTLPEGRDALDLQLLADKLAELEVVETSRLVGSVTKVPVVSS